jgi:hypothetical protein
MKYGIVKTPDGKFIFGEVGEPDGLAISISDGWYLRKDTHPNVIKIGRSSPISMTTRFDTVWFYDDSTYNIGRDWDIPEDVFERLQHITSHVGKDMDLQEQLRAAQAGDYVILSNGTFITVARIKEKTDGTIKIYNVGETDEILSVSRETWFGIKTGTTRIPYPKQVIEEFSIETGLNLNIKNPTSRSIKAVQFCSNHPWLLENITTGNGQ